MPITPSAALGELFPLVHLEECAITNTPPVGVLGDGQAFAATLDVDPRRIGDLNLDGVRTVLARDPAQPSGAQLLIEQPGVARQSTSDLRVLLSVRHEPLWATRSVAERGGGTLGACRAVTAAAVRLRQTLAGRGIGARLLDRRQLRDVLAALGDHRQLFADAWTSNSATHCALSSPTVTASDWHRLRSAATTTRADRVVIARWLDVDDGRAGTTIRLVATDPSTAAAARNGLLATGLARARTGEQPAAIAETLPFGGAPRPLVSALRRARRAPR